MIQKLQNNEYWPVGCNTFNFQAVFTDSVQGYASHWLCNKLKFVTTCSPFLQYNVWIKQLQTHISILKYTTSSFNSGCSAGAVNTGCQIMLCCFLMPVIEGHWTLNCDTSDSVSPQWHKILKICWQTWSNLMIMTKHKWKFNHWWPISKKCWFDWIK